MSLAQLRLDASLGEIGEHDYRVTLQQMIDYLRTTDFYNSTYRSVVSILRDDSVRPFVSKMRPLFTHAIHQTLIDMMPRDEAGGLSHSREEVMAAFTSTFGLDAILNKTKARWSPAETWWML